MRVFLILLLLGCVRDEIDVYPRKSSTKHDLLGWIRVPNTVVKHRKSYWGDAIFDVKYTADSNGLRRVNKNKTAKSHLILLGGSNTFGEGVNDQETFAWNLAKRLSHYQVYNFGERGYGPGHALIQIKENIISSLVQEKGGVLVYFFIPDLVRRVVASWHYRIYGVGAPLFKIDDNNQLIYDRALDSLPDFFNNWLFRKIMAVVDVPTRANYLLAIRILKEIKKTYLEQYPEGRFILMLDPFSDWDLFFMDELKKTDLEINYSKTLNEQDYHFVHDHHLNSKGHQLITDLLFRAITKSKR